MFLSYVPFPHLIQSSEYSSFNLRFTSKDMQRPKVSRSCPPDPPMSHNLITLMCSVCGTVTDLNTLLWCYHGSSRPQTSSSNMADRETSCWGQGTVSLWMDSCILSIIRFIFSIMSRLTARHTHTHSRTHMLTQKKHTHTLIHSQTQRQPLTLELQLKPKER